MKINIFSKIFKKYNILDVEYHINKCNNFSFNVFDNKLDNYSVSNTSNCNINAIIDGKLSVINFDKEINKIDQNIIEKLIDNAKYINKKDGMIYKKKCKYKSFPCFNNELQKIKNKEKINLIFKINDQIKKFSNYIKKIEVNYNETTIENEYANSYNINLKKKYNIFNINSTIVITDGKNTKTESIKFSDNILSNFNLKKYVHQLCKNSIKKLNNCLIKSGKYDVILSPKTVNILTYYYASQLNAENILKKISWFTDKINTQVANKKVNIVDTPLEKTLNFTPFDDQGVPTKNKFLIKNGVLKTYLHNLSTAKIFKTTPTGHAYLYNSKITIKPHNIHLKPGKISLKKIIKNIKNGVYITSLEGLHVGINIENGDFSLKAEGFKIINGKIDKFIDMMTINYNLYKIFKNIDCISKNIEYTHKKKAPGIFLKNQCFISCE